MSAIGGAEGDRTPDLRIANAALCQTELLPHAEKILQFQVSHKSALSLLSYPESRDFEPRRSLSAVYFSRLFFHHARSSIHRPASLWS